MSIYGPYSSLYETISNRRCIGGFSPFVVRCDNLDYTPCWCYYSNTTSPPRLGGRSDETYGTKEEAMAALDAELISAGHTIIDDEVEWQKYEILR